MAHLHVKTFKHQHLNSGKLNQLIPHSNEWIPTSMNVALCHNVRQELLLNFYSPYLQFYLLSVKFYCSNLEVYACERNRLPLRNFNVSLLHREVERPGKYWSTSRAHHQAHKGTCKHTTEKWHFIPPEFGKLQAWMTENRRFWQTRRCKKAPCIAFCWDPNQESAPPADKHRLGSLTQHNEESNRSSSHEFFTNTWQPKDFLVKIRSGRLLKELYMSQLQLLNRQVRLRHTKVLECTRHWMLWWSALDMTRQGFRFCKACYTTKSNCSGRRQ